MTKDKPILDIRIYDADASRHTSFNATTLIIKRQSDWTNLFTFKLRELKLELPGFSHLFIKTTSYLPHLELKLTGIGGDIATFECGIDKNSLSEAAEERENLLLEIITNAFKMITAMSKDELAKVETVRKQLLDSRLLLEVQVGKTTNQFFEVEVVFTIAPVSMLTLKIIELATGHSRHFDIINLNEPADAFWLVRKIQIKDASIQIWPRSSAKSELEFRNNYVLDLDKKGLLSQDIAAIEIPLQRIQADLGTNPT